MKKIKKLLKSIFKKKSSEDELDDYTDVHIQDHTRFKNINIDEDHDDFEVTEKTNFLERLFKGKKGFQKQKIRDEQTLAGEFETVILRGAKKPEQRKFFSRFMIYLLMIVGAGFLFEASGGWKFFSQGEKEQSPLPGQEQTIEGAETQEDDDTSSESSTRKPLIDYRERGAGLVYNCLGGHWACIDRVNYKKCQRLAAHQPPACRALRFFKSLKQCRAVQQAQIDKGTRPTFCQ